MYREGPGESEDFACEKRADMAELYSEVLH